MAEVKHFKSFEAQERWIARNEHKTLVVLIAVTRGGRDPDSYYQVVTESLAKTLDRSDPIRDFDSNPKGLFPDFFPNRKAATLNIRHLLSTIHRFYTDTTATCWELCTNEYSPPVPISWSTLKAVCRAGGWSSGSSCCGNEEYMYVRPFHDNGKLSLK